jgi:hypothetical protein
MAGSGGGRSAFLLFAAFVPHFASFIQASLPMAAVHISTLDYSHYRNEHLSAEALA